MGLKIFGTDPASQPKPRTSFKDDVVGRFRSGTQLNGRPMSLENWRITTGDPDVADTVHDLLGGEAPQEWAAKGEDNLEVFTASKEVEVIIEGAKSLRQRMVLWSRNGKLIIDSDGETLADGTPDPDAELSFFERKQKGRDGTGPEPSIELYFRLAEESDLGIFKFQSGSWTWAEDLARDATDEKLKAFTGPIRATLSLEQVSYVAKNGPRAGQTVSYTKPSLRILGAA